MDEKEIEIIGAGIAGLSIGCYLQMNGYKTQIFEMGQSPGGLCTSWKRKGYTFDGCIHWLVGSSPSVNFYKIWQELGAIQDKKIVDFDEFARIERKNREVFIVYSDLDKLENEMIEIAPKDKQVIEEFIEAIREFAKFEMPIEKAPELYAPIDGMKILFKMYPFLKTVKKWKKITIKDYTQRFKNTSLREIFSLILGIDERFTMIGLIMTLSWMYLKSAGYPIGGSLEFSKSIERRYINLGGKVNYNSKVSKIIVKDNKAVGIKLTNGEIYDTDIVISAADGHHTIFEMLDGKYVNKDILDDYNNLELFPAVTQISLGISRNFDGVPHSISFPLDRPLIIDDKNKVERIMVRIYNFDPTLAAEGKTSAIVYLPSNYEYWVNLRENDREEYLKEKERIAKEVIGILDKRFGDISSKVEVYDVATPATYIRYTNNWKGSFEGWLLTPKVFGRRMKKNLPELRNFYMVGQWVEPGGGLPAVALSGRNLAQIICKKDKKKFHIVV